jgi:metallopeptidase YgjP-like protein
MKRLRADAERIAGHFGLSWRELSPERPHVKRRYGVCFADGRIAVRLSHVKTGKALKYSSLINTVCHELAHLRHFNHGPRFKAFYFEILDFARREGIYRPGKPPRREWVQMDLFGGLSGKEEGGRSEG